jgi:hypothetical protein
LIVFAAAALRWLLYQLSGGELPAQLVLPLSVRNQTKEKIFFLKALLSERDRVTVLASPTDISALGTERPLALPPFTRESIVDNYSASLSPAPRDELERRSRLISLVYEVLRDMKSPAAETTNLAMLSDLSQAFLDKANTLENLEAVALRAGKPKLPANMYVART